MIIQSVNRDDAERVWVAVTNSEGATLTTHWPVSKFLNSVASASVSTNEAGTPGTTAGSALNIGGFIGLADEDIPNGDVGLVQVYGYHESALVLLTRTNVTVAEGNAIAPLGTGSVGLSSVGATMGNFGPVVALSEITAIDHSVGTDGSVYTDHVFLRAL